MGYKGVGFSGLAVPCRDRFKAQMRAVSGSGLLAGFVGTRGTFSYITNPNNIVIFPYSLLGTSRVMIADPVKLGIMPGLRCSGLEHEVVVRLTDYGLRPKPSTLSPQPKTLNAQPDNLNPSP